MKSKHIGNIKTNRIACNEQRRQLDPQSTLILPAEKFAGVSLILYLNVQNLPKGKLSGHIHGSDNPEPLYV